MVEIILTLVTLITCVIATWMLCKKKYDKVHITAQKIINVNNNWISPQMLPECGKRMALTVIVTIRNEDGKIYTQDCIFNNMNKRFTGMTQDFHEKVIAWMPFPEPFMPKN